MLSKMRSLLGLSGAQRANRLVMPSTQEDSASPPSFTILDITDETVDAVLGANEGLLLIDFWAEWCQPCDIMSVHVTMLADNFAGRLLVAAVDVDENPAVSERFIVRGLPTLLFLRIGTESNDIDGSVAKVDRIVEVDRAVGITPYEELVKRTEALLGDPLQAEPNKANS